MSLVVQWLTLHSPNAEGMGLIPGWGTNILHTAKIHQQRHTYFSIFIQLVDVITKQENTKKTKKKQKTKTHTAPRIHIVDFY